MVDLSTYKGNNERKFTVGTVGSIGVTLPGGMGTIANGTVYKLGSLPAGALVTAAYLVVDTAFIGADGTNPATADIKVGSNIVASGANISTAGVTVETAGQYAVVEEDITFIGSNIDTAALGEVRVVIEFVDTKASTKMFTA